MAVMVLVGATASLAQDLTTTSTYGLSFQNQRQMVRATSGTVALVYQKGSPAQSGGGLVLTTSRDHGRTWTVPATLVTNAGVFADVAKGPGDDLYAVYTRNGDSLSASADVGFLKLAYDVNSDTWSVARRGLVFDSSSTTAGYNGVIAWDGERLWVAYRFRDAAGFRIVVKHSIDDGVSWQDAISADTPGSNADETAVFAQVGNRLGLIYYHQDVEFRWRWRYVGDPPDRWQPSETIYTLNQNLPSKSSYSVSSDDQGGLHLLFMSRGVRYLAYEGGTWASGPVLLDAAGTNPKVGSDGSQIWAAWEQTVGSSQTRVVVSERDRSTGVWSVPVVLTESSERVPDRARSYVAAFDHLTDVTAAAGNTQSGDVKSTLSGAMVRDVGDAFYYGQDVPFDYLRIQLKAKGVGGEVVWEYWDGARWAPIAPVTGSYHLTTHASVWLWGGATQIPADWQQIAVGDAAPQFYVRARVTTAFGTAPTGTQVTSVKPNATPTMPERDSSLSIVSWLRRVATPYVVLTAQPAP